MRKKLLPGLAVLTLTLCVSCSSGCKKGDEPVAFAFKAGQTFEEVSKTKGAPCDGYFIDVKSAQKLAMEIMMDKASGEAE